MTQSVKGYKFHPDRTSQETSLARSAHRLRPGQQLRPERQLEQVQVDRLFTDKASGKDTQRPELEALFAFVRDGDTVVVHRLVFSLIAG